MEKVKKSKEESESVNSELTIRRRKRLSIRKNNGIKFGLS